MRSQPLPHCKSSAEQYLSQPQQIRSGCFGAIGNFLAILLFSMTQNKTMGVYTPIFLPKQAKKQPALLGIIEFCPQLSSFK